VQSNADLWLEVLLDGSSLGLTKAGAVPYAVEALHATTSDVAGSADTLGTLAPDDVQQRVTGGCTSSNQSIKTINANGTVTCETDDNTTYVGEDGVAIDGTTISADTTYVQRRVGSCNPNDTNQAIRSIDANGSPTCVATVMTIAGGSTFTVSGPTSSGVVSLSLSSNAVTRSQINGTEVAVYQQEPGCGGGLTTSTSCTTLVCNHNAAFDLLLFQNCAGTTCTAGGSATCTGLVRVGWLLAP
jgi:hypothetical protein